MKLEVLRAICFFSPHVRKFKTVLDSRYRILVSGFQALKHGFWLSIVSGIPGSLSYIRDTKAQDSRYHKHNFPRIPESTSNKFPGFRIPQATYFPDSRIHKQQISRIPDFTSNKFPRFWNPQATNFPDSGFLMQQISQILDSTSNKLPGFRILESTSNKFPGFLNPESGFLTCGEFFKFSNLHSTRAYESRNTLAFMHFL